MKKVYTARDGLEAHFLRNLLEGEGIRAAVLGEALAIARGDLPLTQETLPAVWVSEEDFERACGIAATLNQAPAAPSGEEAAAWECRNCGEMIEPQFTSCWNCGHARQQ
jgi:hypothetical protein